MRRLNRSRQEHFLSGEKWWADSNPPVKRMQAELKAKEEAEEKEKAEKAKAEAEAAEGKEGGKSLGQRFADLFDLPQVQPGVSLKTVLCCL